MTIIGAHILVFTAAVEATRDFLRDALKLSEVDAGGGWLIFALPPAEVAVHPAQESRQELYLMCDDLSAANRPAQRGRGNLWAGARGAVGRISVMTMPGGAQLPIYEPSHPSPILAGGREDQPEA